ncbi:palmitoyltransferase ZDHHC21-like [Ambystoma mexicanum]|uniref:palmitoyltransferase ZDHHC21-like n=1 Tax=Ambystoma mexicanum TaxID=8296 RepID=UPI0037E83BB9
MVVCVIDACGFVCLLIVYLSVSYADYVILRHILLFKYAGSIWFPVHTTLIHLLILMILVSHLRAAFTDPGRVPLPVTAIDFSDLRGGTPRTNERGNEDWTVCNRCETYRPPRAHHCSSCHRCVRRMHHHCPWINNCVGELNQKYFIQFLFYTGVLSLYGLGLLLTTWLWPILKEKSGEPEKVGFSITNAHLAHWIILLIESIVLGLFALVVSFDQVGSIIRDETPIERMKSRFSKDAQREGPHTRKPKMELLREVFGRGYVICWFVPCNGPSVSGGPAYSRLPDYDL